MSSYCLRLALITGLVLLSSACGWVNSFLVGKDNSLPAAKLQPVSQAVNVSQLWSRNASSGNGKSYIRLVPALAQSRIYVAGYKGDVTALAADSGRVVWRSDIDVDISAGVGVGDGLVLVGTLNGEVYALDAENGQQLWRSQVSSEVWATPRTDQGIVVVRSIDGQFSGLDARNGERVWLYSASVPALSLRGSSAPTLAGGAVIAGLDNGRLVLLNLGDGAVVGGLIVAPARGRTEIARLVDIDAEPRLVGSILFVASYQGAVAAIDLNAGNTLWQQPMSSYAGLDADAQAVYLSDADGSVWALDVRNGGSLWKQSELSGRRLSAPVITGRYVVVGDFEGYLHWLDNSTGRIVARTRPDNEAISARPISASNTLYVLSNGGELRAYRTGS